MSDSPFSAEALRKAVDTYFADIPPDHMHATVEYRLSDGTLRFEGVTRMGEHWKVVGSLAWHLKTGKVREGSIRVVGSWA